MKISGTNAGEDSGFPGRDCLSQVRMRVEVGEHDSLTLTTIEELLKANTANRAVIDHNEEAVGIVLWA